MNTCKYRIGDKVRLKNTRGRGWSKTGDMDHFCGKEVVITGIGGNNFGFANDEGWAFKLDDIERLVSRKELTEEYTAFKLITCSTVGAEQPCSGEFSNFVREAHDAGFTFFQELPVIFFADRKEKYPAWIPWLIKHDFLKEVKELPWNNVSIGDSFVFPNCGSIYTLHKCGVSHVCLVTDTELWSSMVHGWEGELVVNKVDSVISITKQEFINILHGEGNNWKKWYKSIKRGGVNT